MIDLSLKSLNDSKMDINGVTISGTNGNIKINGVDKTVYTHPDTHASGMITGLSTIATSGLASDVIFSNANFTSTNVSAAINELFTNVGNGKTQIASAITSKGISASGSDTFATLASKIGQIRGIPDDLKNTVALGTSPIYSNNSSLYPNSGDSTYDKGIIIFGLYPNSILGYKPDGTLVYSLVGDDYTSIYGRVTDNGYFLRHADGSSAQDYMFLCNAITGTTISNLTFDQGTHASSSLAYSGDSETSAAISNSGSTTGTTNYIGVSIKFTTANANVTPSFTELQTYTSSNGTTPVVRSKIPVSFVADSIAMSLTGIGFFFTGSTCYRTYNGSYSTYSTGGSTPINHTYSTTSAKPFVNDGPSGDGDLYGYFGTNLKRYTQAMSQVWSVPLAGVLSFYISADKTSLIVTTATKIYILNKNTGATISTHTLPSGLTGTFALPTSNPGEIYLGCSQSTTGKIIKSYTL